MIDTTNNKVSWRHYQHVLGFDWTSKTDVKRLCKWRAQVFTRVAGQVRFRPTEDLWTVEEMTRLLEYTEDELRSANGIWANINWETIAGRINVQFADREFPRNTPVAAFKTRGENTTHQRKKLARNRPGVTRTGAGIKEQASELADMIELYEMAQLALLPEQTNGKAGGSGVSGAAADDDVDMDMDDGGEGMEDGGETGDDEDMEDDEEISIDQLDAELAEYLK